ncbi:BON domain-containing protein [Deinococcus peraridilitoris]|uniref:Putative periplasmic or secreted lipoprotein n=1 Tax=Deinococcus peraridilitoris (strain DSM 19664 / LMG 22246 / CIP 109416 / KR-200) TaxID=937777 RepID=L0A6U1_DEIPD|nr:BON domain-containing protein [Deinococcus peraridilitoris]AFZ69556.1 putative periplasmic or secreted lipoprotein [Deinococcus peraridilitoris DSM 19664]
MNDRDHPGAPHEARLVPIHSMYGKGPRHGARSDESIQEDVNEALTDDPTVDARDIEVEVQAREVTLHGRVDDRQQKRRAEDVALHVRGVHDVHNRLRVNGSSAAHGAQADGRTGGPPLLVKLMDSGMTIADPQQDIRGRTVLDEHGNNLGHVEHLLIDTQERRVRLLDVRAGGFLGLGEKRFLIPVEAVVSIEGDRVQLNQSRERVVQSPEYTPQLAEQPQHVGYYEPYYGYYGYTPYWGPAVGMGPFPYR